MEGVCLFVFNGTIWRSLFVGTIVQEEFISMVLFVFNGSVVYRASGRVRRVYCSVVWWFVPPLWECVYKIWTRERRPKMQFSRTELL